MEVNCTIRISIAEELIRVLGITEDTLFETYFEDGTLYIRPLSEDEIAELESDEDIENDDVDGLSLEVNDNWECDGDCEECIFEECCPYDDVDCDPEGCECCEYYCHKCGSCTLECGKEED